MVLKLKGVSDKVEVTDMACKDKGELSKPYREKNQLMSLIFIFLMLYQNTARCNLYEYSPVKQQCSNT